MFAGRTIGSFAVYFVISALCIVWLVTLVIIPMLTMTFGYTLQYAVSLWYTILIVVLVVLSMLHNGLDLVSKASKGVRRLEGGGPVKRFSLNQRVQHLWVLVTFTVAAITGFARMYYDTWGKLIITPMGGLSVSADLHLAAAVPAGSCVRLPFCSSTLQNTLRSARLGSQRP